MITVYQYHVHLVLEVSVIHSPLLSTIFWSKYKTYAIRGQQKYRYNPNPNPMP